ncbi:MAG: hypothetical protein KGR25_00730 [Chloroflexi bacterium]|nr:hypothetical protein [Chloroflexota bacterium]
MTARFILDGPEGSTRVTRRSSATPYATEPGFRGLANNTPVFRSGAPPDLLAKSSHL